MTKTTKTVVTWLGVLLAVGVVIFLVVFAFLANPQSEFAGADGQADALVEQLAPDYQPWAQPVIQPPGSETESLVFCLQAAIGSGIFCFGLGYFVAARRYQNRQKMQEDR